MQAEEERYIIHDDGSLVIVSLVNEAPMTRENTGEG
jgi:hypothetical protein